MQIANDEKTIRQATALSEQDQLAMFIAETPALAGLNTLSAEGLQLFQQQSAEKQNQYKIDQLLSLGVGNLNTAQKAQLATLVQQSAEMQQQIALTQQAVDAENQLATATDAVETATKGVVAATQEEVDDAETVSGGISARTDVLSQSGVGGVNQQLQDSLSVANAKQNLESLQANLAKEINGYENSDDPTQEALVPALQAKINALHQQEINISPSNLNGLAPQPYTPPSSSVQTQQQIQLLQGIHDAVVPALKVN